jgi:hypothetical protein
MSFVKRAGLGVALLGLGACSQLGSLGSVLGGVFGGGNQVAGTIQSVDTRNAQISMTQSNGQAVALSFDNNTRVLYQNRTYSVTSLEYGDQVNAYIQQLQNGGYYADSVIVTQPANNSGTTTTNGSNVQTLTGSVRSIDRTTGQFTMDVGNGSIITVSLMYNASSADVNRFNSLRTGDSVRFYGVFLSNTRIELRQFY